jgi:hypothetical protein
MEVRKRKVCHVLAIHFRLKCSINGHIPKFRHYKALLDGKFKEIDTEQVLSEVRVIQKGAR